ncbi:MAG TPA: Crp/Fnr family transcriptional regulator [Pyrinomonadaceae bacterium]|jgi:CRP-like cAMP-binding protein
MTNLTSSNETNDFKKRLRTSLSDKTLNLISVKIFKHKNVYFVGDQAENVYFIDSGQIKLVMLSPEGKECLLCILKAGDIFGELCLSGASPRQETVTAMIDTTLICIPRAIFFLHLVKHSLFEGYLQYLVTRISSQQMIISHLLTVDCEHRLGEMLLKLARELGKPDPHSKRIEQRITHEEFAQMVGTTRPRVTEFMVKFRQLGLISINPKHFLVVNEKKLISYLAQVV